MISRDAFDADTIVKTCPKLESGLNLSIEGLRACTRGALMPPIFCGVDELRRGRVTLDTIIDARKRYIRMLNDDHSSLECKHCLMVVRKRYGDISFDRLGHVDLQHYSVCNLRCKYCAYTRNDVHLPPQYDALSIMKLFPAETVEWNAHVDFAGGEPTLLEDMDHYLEFFRSRRIRVLMFTNGVRFHPSIHSGLADGSIYWVTTSIDAGTPSTYAAVHGRDRYLQVMENLSRYAAAGSRGKGMLAAKYIFCESNCGDDDIAGFGYAMLALRPQQVWLTLDFAPLALNQLHYDYAPQVAGYSRLYLLLKKHGVEAFHYFKEAVATVSPEGRELMNRIRAAIEQRSARTPIGDDDLMYHDFRNREPVVPSKLATFSVEPFVLSPPAEAPRRWSLAGKRVLLAPACPQSRELLANAEVQTADWIGFLDRNPTLQGKSIDGRCIYSYDDIRALGADVILAVPPEKHRLQILDALVRHAPAGTQIAEMGPS